MRTGCHFWLEPNLERELFFTVFLAVVCWHHLSWLYLYDFKNQKHRCRFITGLHSHLAAVVPALLAQPALRLRLWLARAVA